ncbi:hypothetical protein EVG20_g6084 [Dentipellis fragilis]|uniref:HMG box domain-containing protein n=1 Tax=Dentipellis fragilis TaxID=205917 RepID=A0A4Y9YPD8_9AGAM|nr:hypothetical protein EVG20_g6084 [Dentipellis fragilis]
MSTSQEKPPRACNAWILFRCDKIRQLPPRQDGRSRTQPEVSQLISKMWAVVSPQERADYEARAERAKAEHQRKWPNYKYEPVKKEVKEQQKLKRKLERERERAQSGPNQRRKTSPCSGPGPVSAGCGGPSAPMASAGYAQHQYVQPYAPHIWQFQPQLPQQPQPQLPHQPQLQLPQQARLPFPSLSSDPEWRLQTATETSYSPPQNASQNASLQGPQVPAPAVETESEAFGHNSFTEPLGSTGDVSVFQTRLNADSQDFSEPPAELNFGLGSLHSDEPHNDSVAQWTSFFSPQDDMYSILLQAAQPGLEAGARYLSDGNRYQAGEGVFQPSTDVAQGRSELVQCQDLMDFLNLDPPLSASSHDETFGNCVGMSQGSSTVPQAVQHSSHPSSHKLRREYHPPSGASNAATSSAVPHHAPLFSSLKISLWTGSVPAFPCLFAPVVVAVDLVDSSRLRPGLIGLESRPPMIAKRWAKTSRMHAIPC